jgi:hypothetical protein
VYARGGHGGSPQAHSLRRLLRGLPLDDLTDCQLDHLERLLAGGLALLRQHQLKAWCKVRDDWGQRGAPRSGIYKLDHWMDHLSRLVVLETGRTLFRSEPYGIDGEDLRQLVALAGEGWDISIRPELSTHFPGCTMAVIVTRQLQGT